MLYDPKWEVQTKADPLSLDALIAWLEKQPANKPYDYCDYGGCVLAQWITSLGGGRGENDSFNYTLDGSVVNVRQFKDLVQTRPWHFGAALDRARKLRDAPGGGTGG